MRRPRVSVRRLMLLVALSAVVAAEFRHGSPPEFVLRGLPVRVGRLRPGMTWAQTRDVLGLERHWLRGGISAEGGFEIVDGMLHMQSYYVRPPRYVVGSIGASPRGGGLRSAGTISLMFSGGGGTSWRGSPSTRLVAASFSDETRLIARMPTR